MIPRRRASSSAAPPRAGAVAPLQTVQAQCEELLRLAREELVKAGGITALVVALDCGDTTARHSALGALAALASSDGGRWLPSLATGGTTLSGRLLAAAAAAAVGPHERSRVEATRLLACLACVPELAPGVWAAGAAGLIAAMLGRGERGRRSTTADEEGCGGGDGGRSAAVPAVLPATPGWAGKRQLQLAAALALKALIEPSEWEAEAVRNRRRHEALQRAGGLGPLVALAADGGSSTGTCGATRDLAAAAAACLRFVALVPQAAQAAVAEAGCAEALVAALSRRGLMPHGADVTATVGCAPAHPAHAAYLAGVAWELASYPDAAARLIAAGAIEALLQLVASAKDAGVKKRAVGSSGSGSKAQAPGSSADKRGGKGKNQEAGRSTARLLELSAGASDPAAGAAAALVNATGALHHLTMLDEGKARLLAGGGVPLLATLLRGPVGAALPVAWDNALAALWNVSLLSGAAAALAAAGAPPFLCGGPRGAQLPPR
ncbi:hypothetical protein Rsub_08935 [Raphidocelis subcapitata]|uniref:Uncharacterized protein n=1 Tax=Raphidocelis subcapitata TaxID=307507 RepID=A0A2V0P916_9CHLO|nr:hypothetical protein Rsub_08935 [Raphidocelis subcapitata]|eukprot:GBF96059.1 hypothetical protein Rsub_08935 [Raphidocelis subcapitata]